MAPRIALDDDQRFALMKFRRSVADVLKPGHDDRYLLRWLRARNWDSAAAETMLRTSLKWREHYEVDTTLKTWELPEPILSYHTGGVCGYDKDGSPVIVIPFGYLDTLGIVNSTTRQDCVKATIKTIEEYLAADVKADTREIVVIFDMEAFNLKQYAHKPCVDLVIELLQIYEANYPEILKTCYVINAPSVFAIAFNIVKKFLHENTISKIQIHSSNVKKWMEPILSNITPENLPQHYGGTLCDPDGNPKYTTKILPGGKVPKSYYKKNIQGTTVEKIGDKSYTTSTVKSGDKLTLDFIVAEDGCFLRYDFHTDKHDIRFGVTKIDEAGKTTEVLELQRVRASSKNQESGVISCDAPATYIVTFDNSYSFLRSKKLHYCIEISEPISNILPEEVIKDIDIHSPDLLKMPCTPSNEIDDDERIISNERKMRNGSAGEIIPVH